VFAVVPYVLGWQRFKRLHRGHHVLAPLISPTSVATAILPPLSVRHKEDRRTNSKIWQYVVETAGYRSNELFLQKRTKRLCYLNGRFGYNREVKTKRSCVPVRNIAAITYARVSTNGQVLSGLGLADQQATLTKWCTNNELPIVASLIDEGLSGTTMAKREALTQALTMLSQGQASHLVVKNTARLGRKTTDVLRIADLALKQGWSLVVVDLGLDTSTISGRLTLSLLAAVAEHEAAQVSERTIAALSAAKDRGQTLGRPKTVSTQTIAQIVTQREHGATWRAIAQTLTQEGVGTGHGGTWQANTCRRIYDRHTEQRAA
jgi:DNA invertase Pin-like site-specific DNA recombinase